MPFPQIYAVARPTVLPTTLPASSSQHISDRFGARIRTLRKAKGMTQVELAEFLGIDRSYLCDVERGKKNLSLSYMETMALGFGLTLSELVAGL